MPELPEVETVVRELEPLLKGRRITAVKVSRKGLREPFSARRAEPILGQRIRGLMRRGKWIIVCMGGGPDLLIHLGMTGQLMVVPAGEPRATHTHVTFRLDDGRKELRFRDIRRFGSVSVLPFGERLFDLLSEHGSLGPEPFDMKLSDWRARLGATRRCVKAVLLDQRVVAGIGNIYADESLFEARLHPARPGRDLTPREADRLRQAIVTVLNRAIDRRGSSIRNYVGGSGKKGEYQNEFRVYGRTGEACPRCKTSIHCVRLAGRSTHYCPKCQPIV